MIRSLKRRIVDNEEGVGFRDMKLDFLEKEDESGMEVESLNQKNEEMSSLKSMAYLAIEKDFFLSKRDSKELDQFITTLDKLPEIKELLINMSNLEPESFYINIFKSIKKMSKITHLTVDLSGNGERPFYAEAINIITDSLKFLTKLESLAINLKFTQIDDRFQMKLMANISKATTIKTLNIELPSNEMGMWFGSNFMK